MDAPHERQPAALKKEIGTESFVFLAVLTGLFALPSYRMGAANAVNTIIALIAFDRR